MANTLLIAATLPGLMIFRYVYKLDTIEKEPLSLLMKLFIYGAICVPIAGGLEMLGDIILSQFFTGTELTETQYILYMLLENFLIVAVIEEGCKFKVLKKFSWNHRAFDYRFDAVVYSVSVSLGFAVLENILYVFQTGLGTAFLRALTALPLHTICAIFMGYYYGEAKVAEKNGDSLLMKGLLKKGFWVAVMIHGFYDFTASMGDGFTLIWAGFTILAEINTLKKLKVYSASDSPV